MSKETQKGLVRIIGNYTRLLATLVLGLVVVRLSIRWLGDDAFGIISLLGAGLGLAATFSHIIQMSLVRELGHAYHKDEETFKKHYTTVCQVSLVCAILSIITFSIVFALVPTFKIPPHLVNAARWFVVGQAFYTAVMTALGPILNMYLVKERFIGYNIWYVAVRATNILSVLILGYLFKVQDPALGLTLHGILWACLAILGMIIASLVMIRSDKRLKFRLKGSDKDARNQVLSTFSWNTGVQVAMNLHEMLPQILLNFFTGTLANTAWGIGFRFVAYIRMCTTGVQFGSDAVTARISSHDNPDEARRLLQALIGVQTKLTSMIALPAAFGVALYAFPIFDLWVGKDLENYDTVMSYAVYMSRILAIALGARAISETWIIILYGAGHVKQYAPWIFAGGLIAPISSIILMKTLPEHLVIYAPATMFSIVLVVVHLFGLPMIAAKCLHISALSLLTSLIKPLIATLLTASLTLGFLYFTGSIDNLAITGDINFARRETIDRPMIFASILIFGCTYAFLSYALVLSKDERQRITSVITSKLKRS